MEVEREVRGRKEEGGEKDSHHWKREKKCRKLVANWHPGILFLEISGTNEKYLIKCNLEVRQFL